MGTLCWDCANACGDCSWSDYNVRRPVRGWDAIRRDLTKKDGENVESYIVLHCPEFIRDAENGGQRRVKRAERL